ncbi:MAG: YkgJ family cysteine cluster protein [Fidelibacterota bacterium]
MKPRFYDNGLQFECTGCGDCCKYSDAVVYITDHEISAISSYLSIPEDDFVFQYVTSFRNRLVLKSNGDSCILLQNDRCMAYPVRPTQCQSFPFWSDILKSQSRWNLVSETCEGMNHGKKFSSDKIRRIMNEELPVDGISTEVISSQENRSIE